VKRLLLSAVLTLGCLGAAQAADNQVYQCQRDHDMRTLAVEYTSSSCSVMYKKVASSSDPAKELWHYQARQNMCQVQADDFIKKLEGFGLTCTSDKAQAMKQ
jgi:opacity protein-like surface antigen